MSSLIKKIIKKTLLTSSSAFSSTKLGKLINEQIIENVMQREKSIIHNDINMTFSVPNKLNHFRIDTFSEKEPETLEWIDEIPHNSILWDIGANVGLYSIYAAKRRNCQVFAFEPSVFNLELLARNIYLNNLQEQITIFPLALANKLGSNTMRLTSKEWGGALSSFGENLDWDGKKINDIFSFSTFGCTMDQLVSIFKLPKPDYIKMDVDGNEHYILEGGLNILKEIQGILIEINDNYIEQRNRSEGILNKSGLSFKEKRHSEILDSGKFSKLFNQIWVKNNK